MTSSMLVTIEVETSSPKVEGNFAKFKTLKQVKDVYVFVSETAICIRYLFVIVAMPYYHTIWRFD